MLLASDGRHPFSSSSVARAAELAGPGGSVAVLVIAKIYGTQYGLPHPGLMPTKDEITTRQTWLREALATLERRSVDADGQLAATRKPVKKIARVARLRSARFVVTDETPATGLRRIVEGDTGIDLRRKLRGADVAVEIIPHDG